MASFGHDELEAARQAFRVARRQLADAMHKLEHSKQKMEDAKQEVEDAKQEEEAAWQRLELLEEKAMPEEKRKLQVEDLEVSCKNLTFQIPSKEAQVEADSHRLQKDEEEAFTSDPAQPVRATRRIRRSLSERSRGAEPSREVFPFTSTLPRPKIPCSTDVTGGQDHPAEDLNLRRAEELRRRNLACPPHLKTSYLLEPGPSEMLAEDPEGSGTCSSLLTSSKKRTFTESQQGPKTLEPPGKSIVRRVSSRKATPKSSPRVTRQRSLRAAAPPKGKVTRPSCPGLSLRGRSELLPPPNRLQKPPTLLARQQGTEPSTVPARAQMAGIAVPPVLAACQAKHGEMNQDNILIDIEDHLRALHPKIQTGPPHIIHPHDQRTLPFDWMHAGARSKVQFLCQLLQRGLPPGK